LLIAYKEHALPKSSPPPRWSAPAGRPHAMLEELKAGEPVVLVSATLLSAMMAAGLPESAWRRFALDGADWSKAFLLDEQDRLVELSDDQHDRLVELGDG
jgi:hypothetical protein